MEVIEKMEDATAGAICDAGVELVQELASVLRRFGLGPEQAFNVIIVAAAGVSAASELTSLHLAEGVDRVIHMWRVQDVDGGRQAVFDPTHLHAAPAVDSLSSN